MKATVDIPTLEVESMTKRLVEINDADLRKAQELLGATTIRETVERSIKHVIAAEAGRQHIELLKSGYLELMTDEQERRKAWR